MRTEENITLDDARALLTAPGYNAYGNIRLYGVIAEGASSGQAVGIKSTYHLDRFSYSRIYVVGVDPDNFLNIQRA